MTDPLEQVEDLLGIQRFHVWKHHARNHVTYCGTVSGNGFIRPEDGANCNKCLAAVNAVEMARADKQIHLRKLQIASNYRRRMKRHRL